ncbi:ATP-binding protein [Desulfopila aestuarii]|uniref:histidine kinase n=1 Tax=Desulfopila aestuarii DSM 18488 TaxID=1121416 RepID=A0A1M7XY24_9BACT|nr:ATP-binding protein [Desulfopila aestuarii]SHO43779.1 PAS domain S-box-containing protein [Desulfopila aestuarii DSM 18488]
MFSQAVVIASFTLYVCLLFLVALFVERKSLTGRDIGNNPFIYSLSLAVYCSTWTYYGSVGKAVTSGMLFLTIYLGPTIAIAVWWTVLRKMIRVKNLFRITSIADFISARYQKSQGLAALVTVICIVGIAPYVAIQLKSILATFDILTKSTSTGSPSYDVGLIIVGLMIVFTIIFGARRLDSTERHQGMVVALAVECVVKLVAFLSVGIFVTYFMFDGFEDVFARLSALPGKHLYNPATAGISYYMTWTTYLVLAMSAILFLPRQFHVAVVENFEEKHVRTAMWVFPLYMFLINIFVLPMAAAGLLLGLPESAADTFVLALPMGAGQKYLSLLVFLGGFSAAMGMVMISTMTMSTMITNHLVLPAIEFLQPLGGLKRYLIQCRWVAIAAYIMTGYLFARLIGESYMLVNMGMISFAAALQFAPAVLGGLFWEKGNRFGAISGLTAGFVMWFYTLLLPTFVKSGWIDASLLIDGPVGISALNPERLFGLAGLDPLSHGVLWTLLFNAGMYVLGSLSFRQDDEAQEKEADAFINVLNAEPSRQYRLSEPFIEVATKEKEIENLLVQYFPVEKVRSITRQSLLRMGLEERERISIVELIELHEDIERVLAGSIGAAAAYHALRREISFSPQEQKALSDTYAEILANLKLTPSDLKAKIDFYQERHDLLTKQAAELKDNVNELNTEIEERRKAEVALRDSEEKYRTLVNNINIGVFRSTSGRGRFVQVNPAMAKIFGYESVDEFQKVEVVDLYQNTDDREKFIAEIHQNGFVRDCPLAMRKMDGTPIWCSVTATAHDDVAGNLLWIDGVMEDITERKKLEDQLRQSQKMEAIGTLTGGIAHDFNNILTAILGYSNLLRLKIRDDETVLVNYVEQILASSEKAANLTRSLLAFSRKQIIDPKPVDLNEIVKGVQKLLIRVIGEDIEFRTTMADRDLVVLADTGQVEQILLNLATNARDAMPNGGILTIETSYVNFAGDHAGFSNQVEPGEYAVISASDTGIGMDEVTRQRIFEPFFTTKDVGKGTGLGLSIVYGIIKQHRGDVHVYSEHGKGTTFKIYLPLLAREAADSEKKTVEPLTGGTETILVAEDDDDVRKLMVAMLEQFGYTIIEAVDGEDAVMKFSEHKAEIDLLILDVIMPKMNGKESFEQIKKMNPEVKVIFSSGYTADIIHSKGILESGAGFLQKPVQPQALLSLIRKTITG